ncbi:OsmC family protein [Nostocoides japonicum]
MVRVDGRGVRGVRPHPRGDPARGRRARPQCRPGPFRGDPQLTNPEQLLLAAASSCQLLSFLAVAARARLDVVGYVDEASAVMPEDERPMRITEIVLRPRIRLRGRGSEKVPRLVRIAHEECFIANSLAVDVRIEPTVDVED